MRTRFILMASAVLTATGCLPVFAQGTSFTDQGRLNNGGTPANGSYDLTFTLYPTNITGTAIAGPVTNAAAVVINGLFTTLVDFGPGVFPGGRNWLEIAVSTNRANAFTTQSVEEWKKLVAARIKNHE